MKRNLDGDYNKIFAFKALLLASVGISTLLLPLAASAQSSDYSKGEKLFAIEPQTLSSAVVTFGKQSGYQIIADGSLIGNATTKGVKGKYIPSQAMSILLSGTGFTFNISGNVITIQKAPLNKDGSIQLGPVRVEADNEGFGKGSNYYADSKTTEKTGSYTTKATGVALKTATSIRETPQSVTVLTNQIIEDKQIDDMVDVIENTVALSINQYESNRGTIYSRGFQVNKYLIDGISTSIDEQWSAGEVLNSTAIMDRVEILRGADGLMIGTGNPSAAINMVRKRADSDVLTGKFALNGGSWSHYGATADLNSPLTKSGHTRGRLIVDYDNKESYYDRLDNQTYVLYGTIEQDIGDNTNISAGISYQDNQTDSPSWGGVPAWALDTSSGSVNIVRLKTSESFNVAPDWTYWDTDYTNAFIALEHKFNNGWNFKANHTHGKRNSDANIALLYSYPIDPSTGKAVYAYNIGNYIYKIPVSYGYAGFYYVENETDDVKLQLDGSFNLWGMKHEVALGYDRSQEQFKADGISGTIATTSIYTFDGTTNTPSYNSLINYKNYKTIQDAFFISDRITLLEKLHLILGARLINYEVNDHKTSANSYKIDNKAVPYAGVVYDINKYLSAYASYTSIFTPQQYVDVNGKILDPIEGNNYEGGLKAELFDGRVNATLSIFRIEQKNVGTYAGRDSSLNSYYKAIDGVVSKGFEAEIIGELSPGWNASIGYSQFEATEATGDDINTLIPRRQFNLFTTYNLKGKWKNLTIGGGVRWQSQIYSQAVLAQALGVPKLTQKAYAITSLMAKYKINDKMSAQINIDNLLDEEYYAITEDSMQVYRQAPRNANLTLRYEF